MLKEVGLSDFSSQIMRYSQNFSPALCFVSVCQKEQADFRIKLALSYKGIGEVFDELICFIKMEKSSCSRIGQAVWKCLDKVIIFSILRHWNSVIVKADNQLYYIF